MPEYLRIPDLLRSGLFESRESIMLAVRAGRLPRPFRVGKRLLWDADEIREWLESRRIVIYRIQPEMRVAAQKEAQARPVTIQRRAA